MKHDVINMRVRLFWIAFGRNQQKAQEIYEQEPQLKPYLPVPCFTGCIADYASETIFSNEKLSYKSFEERASSYTYDLSLQRVDTIPKILHTVYVFSANKTESEREALFQKHNPYLKHNAEATKHWGHHYIWVNNLELVPQAIKQQYEELRCQFFAVDILNINFQVTTKVACYEELRAVACRGAGNSSCSL